jgi:DNA topoisomerase-1
MRKKPEKSKEQKLAENFFPMDPSDVKLTVEKPYKQPLNVEIETVPKERKKRVVKKKTKKYSKKTSSKKSFISKTKLNYEPPKISLKKDGYELIITEKPQAAMKIADALGKNKKTDGHGVSYYEVSRDGKKIIVACAVGHLFTLTQTQRGAGFPVFDIKWVPNYLVLKKDFTKRYYDNLLSLAKNAGEITVATDYDIEGEVIGFNVVRFICNQKDANRMKFSTLTKPELNSAYESKSPTINWGQAIAGETRHYLDWFYGINLSRALMASIKEAGRFKIMSIGRVQGPALNLIVNRERKIQEFEPQKYWQVFINISDEKNEVELKYNKDIFDKKELSKFENIVGKNAIAKTEKKEEHLPPNPPFNLTGLQMEAYRLYGITPSRALQIAQSLYLAGLISYPRTSSQKLPDSINYKEILEKLAKQFGAEKLIVKKKPIEGSKTDSAHPSIYPTGEIQNLSGEDEKIYNLIAKRFLCLFCEDAILDNKTISAKYVMNNKDFANSNFSVGEADLGGRAGINEQNPKLEKSKENFLIFSTKGSEVRKKSWLEIYPYKIKETELPDMNGEVKITDSRTEEKETQPPKRYSPASIVSELEKKNLGTKATRAAIIETLYDRGYIKEKSIEATSLGISLIETLEKYSPVIIDEELTKKFEKEMNAIVESKKDFVEKEKKVVDEAKITITNIAKDFEKNKLQIGSELMNAETKVWEKQKEENKLNICPKCQKGNLTIMYSRKTRRQFVACDKYPDCKNTFTLPPNGTIKRTQKICEECGFPMLIRLSKGKRPWEFCFNPECQKNKERLEEYRKKKEMENNSES